MNHRLIFALVVASLLSVAAEGSAQFRDPFPYATFSVSPVVGYRLPYDARVEATVFTEHEAIYSEFTEARGGGTLVGGEMELRLIGRLNAVASVLYAQPVENVVTETGEFSQVFTGPTVWMGSLGLMIRLPEPTPDYRRFPFVTSLLVAPALIREVPGGTKLAPDHPLYVPSPWQTIDHPAVNVGFQVTALLGSPNLALQFGVNDFITFWNSRAVESQLERAYLQQLGLDVIAEYAMPYSHQFVGQIGLSFRF